MPDFKLFQMSTGCEKLVGDQVKQWTNKDGFYSPPTEVSEIFNFSILIYLFRELICIELSKEEERGKGKKKEKELELQIENLFQETPKDSTKDQMRMAMTFEMNSTIVTSPMNILEQRRASQMLKLINQSFVAGNSQEEESDETCWAKVKDVLEQETDKNINLMKGPAGLK